MPDVERRSIYWIDAEQEMEMAVDSIDDLDPRCSARAVEKTKDAPGNVICRSGGTGHRQNAIARRQDGSS